MRFLVGALALAVLGVLVGTPAAFVLGWAPLSATNRQSASTTAKNPAAPVSKSSGETAVTVRPKGSFS
jgi:hypothetical protein